MSVLRIGARFGGAGLLMLGVGCGLVTFKAQSGTGPLPESGQNGSGKSGSGGKQADPAELAKAEAEHEKDPTKLGTLEQLLMLHAKANDAKKSEAACAKSAEALHAAKTNDEGMFDLFYLCTQLHPDVQANGAEASVKHMAWATEADKDLYVNRSGCINNFMNCRTDCAHQAQGCAHCPNVENCKGTGPNPDACYICWRKCKDQEESCFKH